MEMWVLSDDTLALVGRLGVRLEFDSGTHGDRSKAKTKRWVLFSWFFLCRHFSSPRDTKVLGQHPYLGAFKTVLLHRYNGGKLTSAA